MSSQCMVTQLLSGTASSPLVMAAIAQRLTFNCSLACLQLAAALLAQSL